MLILVAVGFFSALLSSMSGAGAALFSTPFLLFYGADLPAALASNQFSAALWTPLASQSYKTEYRINRTLILAVACVGTAGVFFGYRVATLIPPPILKPIVGCIMLMVVVAMWRQPIRSEISAKQVSRSLWTTALLGFPLGAYQAFFGSGNTLLSSLVLGRTQGFDFKLSLAHAYAVASVWCSVSALLYWLEGWMEWEIAVPAAVGSVAGAALGSRYGSSLSSSHLRRVFLSAAAIMSCVMLLY
jgi:uncharacterized protein